jgi:hypothetical protein
MRYPFLMLGGLFALLTSPLLAWNDFGPTSLNRGLYVIGGFGYGVVSLSQEQYKSRSNIAYHGALAYQLNRNLGVEIGYMRFPEVVKKEVAASEDQFFAGDFAAMGWTALAKFVYPASRTFDLYAKGGIALASMHSELCHGTYGCLSSFGVNANVYQMLPMATVGFDYYIDRRVSLGLEGRLTLRAGLYAQMETGLLNVTYRLS